MKLGILGAMDEEIELLLENLEQPNRNEYAGLTICEGTLNGLDVVIAKCGIGKVNAAMCAQKLCDLSGITHLVNTGIAGSLCAELDIGDIVISTDAMYHDFDCTHFGYAYGQVPGTDSSAFTADEKLIAFTFYAAEQQKDCKCRLGRVASGDQFVDSPAKKEFIISATKALCTEMEGAAIAHTAWKNGVPFVIVRAISDKADNSAQMDYPTFEKMAAHRCSEIILQLTKMLAEENAK